MPQDEQRRAEINSTVRSLSEDLRKLRVDTPYNRQSQRRTEEDDQLVLSASERNRASLGLARWSLPKAATPTEFSSKGARPVAISGENRGISQSELENLLFAYQTPILTRKALLKDSKYPSEFEQFVLPEHKTPPRFREREPILSSFGRPELPPRPAIIWPANPILFGACLLAFPVVLFLASILETSLWSIGMVSALALCTSLVATFRNLAAYGAKVRETEAAQAAFDEISNKELIEDRKRFQKAKVEHEADLELYKKRLKKYHAINASLGSVMRDAKAIWLDDAKSWKETVLRSNRYIEDLFSDLDNAKFSRLPDLIRIGDHITPYPAEFPRAIEVHYDPESKIIVITKELPNLRELKVWNQNGNGHQKAITKADLKRLEKSLPCTIAILTADIVFGADYRDAIEAICFNGKIFYIDPKDGHRKDAIVMSSLLKREDIDAIKLPSVDPLAAITALKGRLSADFGSAAPVSPILTFDTADSRVVESRLDLGLLNATTNLAEMHWEDFEALVREVFAFEFSGDGMEIQVTQASRDGGVDAIAWDSDPIRGGKFVFQAKRYTNVVDVAAVRDLFGVVMHEGANRGILVTTSSFGPDAYRFAEGKPLTLLDGNQLLGLLERHGYKVRIDLEEARGRIR